MFDLSPLYRSTVGFERLAQLFDQMADFETPSYPPYNIERLGENEYQIAMVAAGFAPEDLVIEVKENTLTVWTKKPDKTEREVEVLHQGIAMRGFERRFELADYVEVTGADMENGLLHITLKRTVPEAMKPRLIPIGKGPVPKIVEGKKAA
jgi:molecular chaperone IbpA